jgi:hypothetical protein
MGMTLVESDGEAEFGTLQGVVRVFLPNTRWNQTMGARPGFMYTQGRPSICCEVYRLYVYTGRHFTDQDS